MPSLCGTGEPRHSRSGKGLALAELWHSVLCDAWALAIGVPAESVTLRCQVRHSLHSGSSRGWRTAAAERGRSYRSRATAGGSRGYGRSRLVPMVSVGPERSRVAPSGPEWPRVVPSGPDRVVPSGPERPRAAPCRAGPATNGETRTRALDT